MTDCPTVAQTKRRLPPPTRRFHRRRIQHGVSDIPVMATPAKATMDPLSRSPYFYGDGDVFDDFLPGEIDTEETKIFFRRAGRGKPLLLLHGFPQTHVMWRAVAPLLAQNFEVVCADLRGYGRSGCPVSTPDHAPYSKRVMADDMVHVMEQLGFPRFSVAGHDRGGRVAYRMALDHPGRIDRLAVLDIVPTAMAWDRANADFALAYWPWSLLAQPEPLPEQVLSAAGEAIINAALGGWGSPAAAFPAEVVGAYVEALKDAAHIHGSAKNTGLQPRLTVSMTRRIIRPVGASCVLCWHSGAPEVRLELGTTEKADRLGSGNY